MLGKYLIQFKFYFSLITLNMSIFMFFVGSFYLKLFGLDDPIKEVWITYLSQ